MMRGRSEYDFSCCSRRTVWFYVSKFTLIVQVNKEKIFLHSNKPNSNHGVVTIGRKGCYRPLLLYLKIFFLYI